jgi:hypothetical protein
VANEARLEAKKAVDEKRQAERTLNDILARKQSLAHGSSPKALVAQVLKDAAAEVRRLKLRLARSEEQARHLRKNAKSLSRWVTNPGRMIWLKIAKLHQQDRIKSELRTAEARLLVRREWLGSTEGKIWIDQGRCAPDWRKIRTEERRAWRHVRRAERSVVTALTVARQAEGLAQAVYGRAGMASGIELVDQPDSRKQYLGEMGRKIQDAIQALQPELSIKFRQGLEKGRGRGD